MAQFLLRASAYAFHEDILVRTTIFNCTIEKGRYNAFSDTSKGGAPLLTESERLLAQRSSADAAILESSEGDNNTTDSCPPVVDVRDELHQMPLTLLFCTRRILNVTAPRVPGHLPRINVTLEPLLQVMDAHCDTLRAFCVALSVCVPIQEAVTFSRLEDGSLGAAAVPAGLLGGDEDGGELKVKLSPTNADEQQQSIPENNDADDAAAADRETTKEQDEDISNTNVSVNVLECVAALPKFQQLFRLDLLIGDPNADRGSFADESAAPGADGLTPLVRFPARADRLQRESIPDDFHRRFDGGGHGLFMHGFTDFLGGGSGDLVERMNDRARKIEASRAIVGKLMSSLVGPQRHLCAFHLHFADDEVFEPVVYGDAEAEEESAQEEHGVCVSQVGTDNNTKVDALFAPLAHLVSLRRLLCSGKLPNHVYRPILALVMRTAFLTHLGVPFDSRSSMRPDDHDNSLGLDALDPKRLGGLKTVVASTALSLADVAALAAHAPQLWALNLASMKQTALHLQNCRSPPSSLDVLAPMSELDPALAALFSGRYPSLAAVHSLNVQVGVQQDFFDQVGFACPGLRMLDVDRSSMRGPVNLTKLAASPAAATLTRLTFSSMETQPVDGFLDVLSTSFPRLTKLSMTNNIAHNLDNALLAALVEHSPLLETVYLVQIGKGVDASGLAQFARLRHLRVLHVDVDASVCAAHLLFHARDGIANNCLQLERIDIHTTTSIPPVDTDAEALKRELSNKSNIVAADSFAPSWSKLTKLRRVKISGLTCQLLDERGLECMSAAPNIVSLQLPGTLVATSAGLCHISKLSQLRELVLHRAPKLDDAALIAITRGCPLLRTLVISHAGGAVFYKVTVAALEALERHCKLLREVHAVEFGAGSAMFWRSVADRFRAEGGGETHDDDVNDWKHEKLAQKLHERWPLLPIRYLMCLVLLAS